MRRAAAPAPARIRWGRGAGRLAIGTAAATLALVASCAPHRLAPPSLSARGREALYREALGRREGLGRAVDAEITLWARRGDGGHWRGVTGALSLASPEACRLRVASMFGTAFDVAVRGDSVVALLPARRLGVAADATHDRLGLRRPGALGFRTLAAAWRPPEDAWASASGRDGMLTLRWAEAGDSLRLTIGPDGLPGSIALTGGGLDIRARYLRWMRHAGVAWPSAIEFDGRHTALSVRLRLERARFRSSPDADRLAVSLPAGTDSLDWPGFRRALDGIEELR